jgi:hypothetical protein
MKTIVKFDRFFFESDHPIAYIGKGSFGGKAKGLVLIQDILDTKLNKNKFPGFTINIPKMIVICTGMFDAFMQLNDFDHISDLSDDRIAQAFQKADLPFEMLGDLRTIVSNVRAPLAIRSSSMLEDAMYEPFAGIYGTKMTPNNQYDIDVRFSKLVEAIKFVYASTYFKAARDYMDATRHKIEDEKMAVIIQEVVGSRHNEKFYPEISGVARSYNFYSFGHAKPENGVVNLALGLGKTIVEGGTSWSYSPSFPEAGPPFNSTGDMLKQTQTKFWAVNMGRPPEYNPVKETEYLVQKSLVEAETDGTLRNIVSTYDASSDRVWIGQSGKGPRILTFAPILIMKDIPLNDLIRELLVICEEELKAPVEIEFAMTFSNDKKLKFPYRFGFLQVRPMVVSTEEVSILSGELNNENVLTTSESVLGNGVIHSIKDIVYVDPNEFETKSASQIAFEVAALNRKLVNENRPYILIGFGRWGTSDPSAGIPVQWGQISGAKVIVEASLADEYTEMSQGSHFFHNVTSFKVCYFSIPFKGPYKIDWDWIAKQELIEETRFIKHIRTNKPLRVKVDGRTGRGVIFYS